MYLLCFAMRGVRRAGLAVLFELEPVLQLFLVLVRIVPDLLTRRALHLDKIVLRHMHYFIIFSSSFSK